MNAGHSFDSNLSSFLNDLFVFSVMLVIAAILTAAMVFQYHGGEIPCPLCLLQRAAMFGICFGTIMHFRRGHSARNIGMSMLFAMLLLIVSARQTLIDIYPRAGHAYIGSAVFGLHMPVWSIVIALAILLAFTLKLAVLGEKNLHNPEPSATLSRLAGLVSLYVIALCAINFLSVIVQCGVGACHTFGYILL
ncbi:MAG TPA: disulfide bond formation protein B [Rhizobium sp.]